MAPPNELENETEYLIRDKFVAEDQPIDVKLSTMDRYHSDGSSQEGEQPKRVRSGGTTAPIGGLSEEWSDILLGVEGRMVSNWWSDGSRGGLTKGFTIRVHPEACPVLIEVDYVHSYTSEYHNSFVDRHYAVSVVKRGRGRRARPGASRSGLLVRLRRLLP